MTEPRDQFNRRLPPLQPITRAVATPDMRAYDHQLTLSEHIAIMAERYGPDFETRDFGE